MTREAFDFDKQKKTRGRKGICPELIEKGAETQSSFFRRWRYYCPPPKNHIKNSKFHAGKKKKKPCNFFLRITLNLEFVFYVIQLSEQGKETIEREVEEERTFPEFAN